MRSINDRILFGKAYDKRKSFYIYFPSFLNQRKVELNVAKVNKIELPKIENDYINLKGRKFSSKDIMNTIKIIEALGYTNYDFYLSDNIKKPLICIVKDFNNNIAFGIMIRNIN